MAKATQELKYKRLKVGHACYVCRSKKIKCDGLRPCMQCKARGRNCPSSSTDGSLDTTSDRRRAEINNQIEASTCQTDADDECILFSNSKHSATMRKGLKERDTWTHNAGQLCFDNYRRNQKLGEYPVFGRFNRWMTEPPLPSKYSVPIEMFPIEMQMHLIHQFFETSSMISSVIPKRLFYEQLRVKGPLITPLLLNAIYCIASYFSTSKNVPKPKVFFNRAKMLVDDFLDTPRVSTVAALYLLSFYETEPASEQQCRSWMYNGMACRMCLELGLNIDSQQCQDMPQEDIELRRRVYWSCYCLDKFQAANRERLWALPASLATTSLPQPLPGDDEADKWGLFILQQKAKLALIGEECLQMRASYAIREDFGEEKFHAQLVDYYNNLVQWRENLSMPGVWNYRHYETIEDVLNETKKPPRVGYLLVIYYFMLCDTLSCLPYTPSTALQHRVCAALLIRHVEYLCDDSFLVLRYEYLGHIVIAAIRVHILYLRDPDPVVARQSWNLFNQCVRALDRLGILAMFPEFASVLQHIATLNQQAGNETQQQEQSASEHAQALNVEHTVPPLDFKTYNARYTNNDSLQQQSIPQLETQQDYVHDPYKIGSQSHQPVSNSQLSVAGKKLQRTIVAFGESLGMNIFDKPEDWNYNVQHAQPPPPPQQQTSQSQPHYQLATAQQPVGRLQQLQPDQLRHPQQQQLTPPQQFQGHIPLDYTVASTNPIIPHGAYHTSAPTVMDSNGMPTYVTQTSSSHNVQQNMSINAISTHTDSPKHSNANSDTVNSSNISNAQICYTNLPDHIDNLHQHAFYPN